MPEPTTPPLLGETLLGKLKVKRLLGEGGMSAFLGPVGGAHTQARDPVPVPSRWPIWAAAAVALLVVSAGALWAMQDERASGEPGDAAATRSSGEEMPTAEASTGEASPGQARPDEPTPDEEPPSGVDTTATDTTATYVEPSPPAQTRGVAPPAGSAPRGEGEGRPALDEDNPYAEDP